MTPHCRSVIVVGSGPAGATAAAKLVQCGIPVTMLESGQNLPSGLLLRAMGKNLLQRWPDMPQETEHGSTGNAETKWPSNLFPGGLSNFWGGVTPRFAPEDFYEGQRLHERYRWPVTYDELAPYYTQAEKLLRVSGARRAVPHLPAPTAASFRTELPGPWRRVAAFAEAAGHGLTVIPKTHGRRSWIAQRWASPFNSFGAIVRPLLRSPLFRLILGAHALRVECSGGRRVTHVLYSERTTNRERRVPAAAVVLAAGPLGSTKLLLQSANSTFPEGLGNTEGVLGTCLHDHPLTTFDLKVDPPIAALPDGAYLTRGDYETSPPLRAAGCLVGAAQSDAIGCAVFGTVTPTQERYVQLDQTRLDEFGLPMLNIHMTFTAEDTRTLARAKARLMYILDSAGHRCSAESNPLPAQPPGSSFHFGGTARMHRSPQYGMLNGFNRLHAVANIAVVDASSFTTGVEKNPTLTVMALAARAADRLALDLKAS